MAWCIELCLRAPPGVDLPVASAASKFGEGPAKDAGESTLNAVKQLRQVVCR